MVCTIFTLNYALLVNCFEPRSCFLLCLNFMTKMNSVEGTLNANSFKTKKTIIILQFIRMSFTIVLFTFHFPLRFFALRVLNSFLPLALCKILMWKRMSKILAFPQSYGIDGNLAHQLPRLPTTSQHLLGKTGMPWQPPRFISSYTLIQFIITLSFQSPQGRSQRDGTSTIEITFHTFAQLLDNILMDGSGFKTNRTPILIIFISSIFVPMWESLGEMFRCTLDTRIMIARED